MRGFWITLLLQRRRLRSSYVAQTVRLSKTENESNNLRFLKETNIITQAQLYVFIYVRPEAEILGSVAHTGEALRSEPPLKYYQILLTKFLQII